MYQMDAYNVYKILDRHSTFIILAQGQSKSSAGFNVDLAAKPRQAAELHTYISKVSTH